MKKILPLYLTIAFLFPSILLGADFSGKVVGVKDGDSIQVMHDGKAEEVRLFGVDCPEYRQAHWKEAKRFTSEMVMGETVTVRPVETDRYGRTIADVISADGRHLGQELVKAGLAWWYRYYAPDDTELKRFEKEARESKSGLWSDQNPTPPWKFRRKNRVK